RRAEGAAGRLSAVRPAGDGAAGAVGRAARRGRRGGPGRGARASRPARRRPARPRRGDVHGARRRGARARPLGQPRHARAARVRRRRRARAHRPRAGRQPRPLPCARAAAGAAGRARRARGHGAPDRRPRRARGVVRRGPAGTPALLLAACELSRPRRPREPPRGRHRRGFVGGRVRPAPGADDRGPERGPRPWAVALPVAAGLAALALWQAGSLKLGGIFLGAAVAAVVTLLVLARGLVGAARRLPRAPWPAWRHGLGGLRRPGGHPARVVVALGAGVMLLVAVALLQDSLDAQIDHERRREAPSFFFVDVQPDQREAFARVLARTGGGVTPALTPIVRARLAAVNGVRVTRDLVRGRVGEDREGAFYYTREYALTWSAEPPPGNVLTRGRWWGPDPGPPRISVAEAMAKQLGMDAGGRLTVHVQGVSVEAEVASLRKVDWQTLGTNFFVVFSPGALDGAPVTFVATARTAPAAEGAVADAVAAAFPNVTAIPVRDVLERVGAVLGDIAVAIRVMALFTVATGVVVMAGALTATRYQRL